MLHLTTSKRISLKFTLYTIGIVFFFWFLVNILFFQQRYGAENWRLKNEKIPLPNLSWAHERFQMPGIEELPYQDSAYTELKHNSIFSNISEVDNQYLIYSHIGDTIRVSNVTRMVQAQQKMALIFLILLIIFSLWTYGVSLIFVRSSLRNINQLVDYVKNINILTLHEPVPLSGPPDDEIRIIGETLQQTLTIVKEQTDSLRDFVTHASHELKTPLMSLSAVMDAGQKTGNYEKAFVSAKQTLRTINTLFETLLSITKREYHNIQKENIDIIPIMSSIKDELAKTYKDKNIICSVDLPPTYIQHSNKDIFHIIFFNLLQNAYKYTPEKGLINIQLKKDVLSVINSWPGIDEKNSKNIREKFWKNHAQEQSRDWFGLGLYLVKLLVTKHQRKISMSSIPDKKTTFSISFGK